MIAILDFLSPGLPPAWGVSTGIWKPSPAFNMRGGGGQKPEGQFAEVSDTFSKPGADPKPVPKVSFVTKAGDLGCGVGYYK